MSSKNAEAKKLKTRNKREADDSEDPEYADDIVNIAYDYNPPNITQVPGWSSSQAEHAARQLCNSKVNEIRTKFPACTETLKDVSTDSCTEDIKVRLATSKVCELKFSVSHE